MKDYFLRKKFDTQKNNFINKFYICTNIFLIALRKVFKNEAILINHGSFLHGKDYLQLDRFEFLDINSLMAETIKKHFSETKFL